MTSELDRSVVDRQAAKRHAYEFVQMMGVVRWSTLVRLFSFYLGPKSDSAWRTYVHRFVKDTDLVYLRRSRGAEESIIGTDDSKRLPLIEVQAAHELRVAEAATAFILEGFSWTPPAVTGRGASKVSDGTAWLNDARIEVEIELSPKKQSRWNGIIARYRAEQERSPVGIVYLFGSEGLRRSFRNVMATEPTPGWWKLALSDSDKVAERHHADSDAAAAARAAIELGHVVPTGAAQTDLFSDDEANRTGGYDASTPPAPIESESQRLQREFYERRAQKERGK